MSKLKKIYVEKARQYTWYKNKVGEVLEYGSKFVDSDGKFVGYLDCEGGNCEQYVHAKGAIKLKRGGWYDAGEMPVPKNHDVIVEVTRGTLPSTILLLRRPQHLDPQTTAIRWQLYEPPKEKKEVWKVGDCFIHDGINIIVSHKDGYGMIHIRDGRYRSATMVTPDNWQRITIQEFNEETRKYGLPEFKE